MPLPAAELLSRSFDPVHGRDRSSGIELWHVREIVGWNGGNTVSLVYGRLPYGGDVGVAHPDPGLGGCTLREYHVQDRWPDGSVDANLEPYWNAIVAVYFDEPRYGPGRFGRRGGAVSQYTETVYPPVWVSYGVSPSLAWSKTTIPIERTRIRRHETRFVPTEYIAGANLATMMNFCGTVFILPNDSTPHLFKGPIVDDLNNGLSRIVFVFESTTVIKEIAVGEIGSTSEGHPIPGKTIPALNHLENWTEIDQAQTEPSDIVVVPWPIKFNTANIAAMPFF